MDVIRPNKPPKDLDVRLNSGRSFRGRNYGKRYFRGQSRPYRGKWRKMVERSVSEPKINDDTFRELITEDGTLEANANLTYNFTEKAEVINIQRKISSNCPFKSWGLYMKDEPYNAKSLIVRKINIAQQYIEKSLRLDCSEEIDCSKWETFKTELECKAAFTFNVKGFLADPSVVHGWPDAYNDIKETPEEVISCIGLAMHETIIKKIINDSRDQLKHLEVSEISHLSQVFNLPKLTPRFCNFEPVLLIQKIKSNCFKRFVSVKGTVVKVSSLKPLCTKMAFKCFRCQSVQVLTQPYGKYVTPSRCFTKGCNSHSFEPLRSSEHTETVNWQCIRLQEMNDDSQHHAGSMPKAIRCELMYDLVDTCIPGDDVIISGVVKVIESEDNYRSHRQINKQECKFLLYISVNSIVKCKSFHPSANRQEIMDFNADYSEKELYAIKAIYEENNVFRLLVASLCPSIYGHEIIKGGYILGLFGGTQKYLDDEDKISVRGDPHILVVGDPGLGKSQMLQSCAAVAPRGVYVCGNTTSISGLTVTLNREGSGGDYSLEAGALILSDQGCCCIDEFDKMTNQHSALLETMEQQSISLAKAGLVCNFPARASILAAANPVGGHYNKAKTVAENLKLGSALLSRFDLVFILLDKPDEENDCKLSKHIMALHTRKEGRKAVSTAASVGTPSTSSLYCSQNPTDKTLQQRLKYGPDEVCDPIPHKLLRKYISYARQYVHPRISPEAAQQLQNFYLELRKRLQTSDSTPITTRQLESLIRLTEARAKLELREVCTKQDADDVIEIMRHSMADVWTDETGFIDILRSQHGSGMSGRSQGKKFVTALTHISERTYNSLFSMQQLRQIAKDIGIQIADFESFISSLNNQGFLLKKGPKVFQLLTSDC